MKTPQGIGVLAVVRALINRPKLLLADEPTGALDRARRMERVYELRDGRIEPCGSGEMRREEAE